MRELMKYNLRTMRAYLLKEDFHNSSRWRRSVPAISFIGSSWLRIARVHQPSRNLPAHAGFW